MKKYTITEISEKTGLSTGNVSDLENNKFLPSANSLIKFSKIFDIHIDWILTGEKPIFLPQEETVQEKFEEEDYLTEEEKDIIKIYRSLNEDKKRDIRGYLNVVSKQ